MSKTRELYVELYVKPASLLAVGFTGIIVEFTTMTRRHD